MRSPATRSRPFPSLCTNGLTACSANGGTECYPATRSSAWGDVAHPNAWRDRRLMLDVRNCPGRRVLILGNHDVEDTEALRDAGFVEQHAAALCATDLPLALTHMPLRRVPLTAINVHGHLHGVPAPSPRHLNVCVERTDYAPGRLDQLLTPVIQRAAAS